jgi:hypothetical protein
MQVMNWKLFRLSTVRDPLFAVIVNTILPDYDSEPINIFGSNLNSLQSVLFIYTHSDLPTVALFLS